MDPILASFLIFMAVGFLAQLVDGAVGMAYGVTSATFLLAFGIPPANVSASVHASKVFTCAASAWAHVKYGNTVARLAFWLGAGGIVGGIVGAYILTSIPPSTVKPIIITYLAIMGVIILTRSMRPKVVAMKRDFSGALPLGTVGGFLDAMGGGGWGPTVTTTLMGVGVEPRAAIGSTNTAEFFVAVAVSVSFVTMLLTGHWDQATELTANLWPVLGLIAGGLIAAPLAARVTRVLPATSMTWVVGLVVIGLALWQGLQWAKIL